MTERRLDRAALEGIDLEYESRGTGEPVILVHAGIFADFFVPLLDEPALVGRYRVISYRRAGCGGSSRPAGPLTVTREAGHCRSLMRHLGINRAHVVGHSNSGNLALQLALDAPDAVQSLALLETALQTVPSAPERARAFLMPAFERYRARDKAGALDTFLRGTCGPDYRAVLDRVLPGAFDRAVADADTFFEHQLPALQQWPFTREIASRVTQPVLAVIGGKSSQMDPIWNERQHLLEAWLPRVEPLVIADATHLMAVRNPREVAESLAEFFARHSMAMPV